MEKTYQYRKDFNKIHNWLVEINKIGWLKRFFNTKIGSKILDKTIERKIQKYSKRW